MNNNNNFINLFNMNLLLNWSTVCDTERLVKPDEMVTIIFREILRSLWRLDCGRFDTISDGKITWSLVRIYKNSHFIRVAEVSTNVSVATKMILSESLSSFPFGARKRWP